MNKPLFFLCIASISVSVTQGMDNSAVSASSAEDIFGDLPPLKSLESASTSKLSDLVSLQSISTEPVQDFNLPAHQPTTQSPEINAASAQLPVMQFNFFAPQIKTRKAAKRKLSNDKEPLPISAVSDSLNHSEYTQSQAASLECNTCKRVFNDPGNLQTHLIIHTGAKPFPCQLCGRAFRRRHHLQNHEASAKCKFWTEAEY